MRFQKKLLGSALILLSALSSALAQQTHDMVLDNGMHIIVREDHRAPVVVHMVWYRAGSVDEVSGTTGVAHVLEHMMFKGTKRYPPGEFNRLVAAEGGQDNAFTGRDYTAYFQQVPTVSLEKMMKLEADRMENLVLKEEDFVKEIEVVKEERRWRTDDQPAAQLDEAVYAAAFMAHPYHWPIIGWMSDLDSMTVLDARKWYERWYTPNNATMVVVGDVKAEDVFRLAGRHFGSIRARNIVPARPQHEPEQHGIRRITVKAPAENAMVVLAFKVPTLKNVEADEDVYALDVLAAILDGYDNARLSAKLVRKDHVASSVSVEYGTPSRGPALFTLAAVPVGQTGAAELEKRMRAEIARIAKEGVAQVELDRVKMQLISSQIYKRDSLFGQALEIGLLEMTGLGYEKMDRIIEKLKGVTSEQIQSVASRYFGDDQLTVGVLHPLPMDPDKKAAPAELRH